jgi:YVTN family beta-propeller protein
MGFQRGWTALLLLAAVQGHADGLSDVLVVGNSVAGTVTVIDPSGLKALGSINVVPDLEERLSAIKASPLRHLLYGIIKKGQLIRHFEPAEGDRFVDDAIVSPDGARLYVSRANLGDVAAFDLTTFGFPLVWRTDIAMFKADHAALSPDGTRLVVSASLARKAQVLETSGGQVVGEFKTGTFPHQNDFSRDGTLIYNASIGNLPLPAALRGLKGARRVTVVDARTLKTVRTYSFPDGVRPAAFSADERTLYAQLSYLNGLVKFDLASGKVVGRLEEPLSPFAQANYPTLDDYPHNSAHHGLAISGDGTRLCDAGTIDNTVSIVAADSLKVLSTASVGMIPYWAQTSVDGTTCFVSLSGDDAVSVIDYATGSEIARIPVGHFPQRIRATRLRADTMAFLD